METKFIKINLRTRAADRAILQTRDGLAEESKVLAKMQVAVKHVTLGWVIVEALRILGSRAKIRVMENLDAFAYFAAQGQIMVGIPIERNVLDGIPAIGAL